MNHGNAIVSCQAASHGMSIKYYCFVFLFKSGNHFSLLLLLVNAQLHAAIRLPFPLTAKQHQFHSVIIEAEVLKISTDKVKCNPYTLEVKKNTHTHTQQVVCYTPM